MNEIDFLRHLKTLLREATTPTLLETGGRKTIFRALTEAEDILEEKRFADEFNDKQVTLFE